MAGIEACLLDAFGTILTCDFTAHTRELPVLAGIPADAMYAEFARIAPALTDGRLSMAQAYAHILRTCGAEPRPDLVRALVDRGMELLLASGRLFGDVLPFMAGLRDRGIKIAIVSNCDEQGRGLFGWLGVTPLADALVLSCEVGAAKPSPRIFQRALDALGVRADAALFVDDNPGFCAEAVTLGIRAAQIVRGEPDTDATAHGAPVVRSLAEVEAMLPA
ncbi:MAG TPA: HAD-IA family hydrolase [Streptosporangiaceae bacterium]|nr:HAD-IA family hydrolase [Streptosporangiaceae bacterium]